MLVVYFLRLFCWVVGFGYCLIWCRLVCGGLLSIAVFIVLVFMVYFSLGLWVLWLDVRLLVIRCLVWLFLWVMLVLVGLLVLRLFNCWLGFGLSLFCVLESGGCGLCLCLGAGLGWILLARCL